MIDLIKHKFYIFQVKKVIYDMIMVSIMASSSSSDDDDIMDKILCDMTYLSFIIDILFKNISTF